MRSCASMTPHLKYLDLSDNYSDKGVFITNISHRIIVQLLDGLFHAIRSLGVTSGKIPSERVIVSNTKFPERRGGEKFVSNLSNA